MYVCMYVFDCTIWGFHPLGKPAELTAQYLILNLKRKLTPSERNEAAELLKLRVNNKLLQQHLSQSTGKIVTLKDISNIKHSIQKMDGNDLENCLLV